MNNISLKSIKYESIKSIFTSIADSEKISRASISELTDLSLVTVGKIADALLDMNVISQVKEVRPQAGRRAGLLSVNEEKFTVIFDLTSRDFRCALLNLRLAMVERFAHTYDDTLTYRDNLNAFLSSTAAYLGDKYDLGDCYGIGVSVPGAYKSQTDTICTRRIPELRDIGLKELISQHFPSQTVLIDSHINASAKSNVRRVEDYHEKNVIYYYVSPHFVIGVYMVNGELILGRNNHACDFGFMVDSTGTTLEDRLAECTAPEEYTVVLSRAVYNMIRAFNPHEIILECDLPVPCDEILTAVREDMMNRYGMTEEELPAMTRARCKFRNSHRGLAIGLRELWLESLVFANN
ncbi:MAG: ROK family protein [Clostridia bacterium]|nr:ROK family protein [Clostridia bacterium]MBQ8512131.1 ROK family protein [Clostridia bacterium]